ncbi:DNA-binding transcriptional LysR family regulator [Rhizobium sp. BK275]|uniref:LysR family transcriptional regulator n=1 Tax=unclassified Rhizobium TaxID=2613769 RepID=UPI00160C62BC|nr:MULTISPECIES: LysR family transcriptional regulator [unclassified Rhizobium]MBB3390114.1 DNA-binding transcriptional LysR family regulator [Rhizobium sp. BK275]MBB3409423.1 DNA-binding transcriptional LysR family regulator [Rhizobium sp. BK316]
MDDLPLSDLDAFAAIARERSFRSAARKRGVSASSLSDSLRRLEERLGVRLLNRTTRSVTPTAAGERLLEKLSPALSEVAAALGQLDSFRDNPVGTLRLNVPSIVVKLFMADLAVRFLALYPQITLEIIAEDTFIDVLAAGFDAGVRYDERLERDMIAVPIGPRRQRYVTAAAPAYLERRGVPQHPRDLLEHSCIRHRFLSGASLPWEFERGEEVLVIAPSGPVIANAVDMEIEAALAGLGVVRTFEELVVPGIADGRLMPILSEWDSEFSGPFLYYPSRHHMPAPLRAFVDFVRMEQRKSA